MKKINWFFCAVAILVAVIATNSKNSKRSEIRTERKDSKFVNKEEAKAPKMTPEKKRFILEYNQALENGTLTYWQGPKAVFLDLAQINLVKKSLNENSRVIKEARDEKPLLSSKEAYDFLTDSVSMTAFGSPNKYFEDEEFYYFSGGTEEEAVNDFSSGYKVDKKKRTVVEWRAVEEEI